MNLHEYQGKNLIGAFDIAVPRGGVAASAGEARAIAGSIDADSWYVKAQILAGGRASGHFKHAPGSAGGVRLCHSLDEVERDAADMLGEVLFTLQTGLDGAMVHQVYVEEAVDVSDEFYVALLVDRRSSCVSLMTSRSGGAFIEQTYASDPDSLAIWVLDLGASLDPATAHAAAESLGVSGDAHECCSAVFSRLYQLFVEKDCSLIEVNPLACTTDGGLCVLDATVKIDDNALFRQVDLQGLRDTRDLREGELDALRFGFNYFKLEGDVGIVASGASMAMATLDTVKLYGGEPANFLDIPPVSNTRQFVEALNLVLSDPSVRVVLINIFAGGVMRGNDVAEAVLQALQQNERALPLVVRLAGTDAELGVQRLLDAAPGVQIAADMVEAAQSATQLATTAVTRGSGSGTRAAWWGKVRRGEWSPRTSS